MTTISVSRSWADTCVTCYTWSGHVTRGSTAIISFVNIHTLEPNKMFCRLPLLQDSLQCFCSMQDMNVNQKSSTSVSCLYCPDPDSLIISRWRQVRTTTVLFTRHQWYQGGHCHHTEHAGAEAHRGQEHLHRAGQGQEGEEELAAGEPET